VDSLFFAYSIYTFGISKMLQIDDVRFERTNYWTGSNLLLVAEDD
jgi:hypothetical protein